jgi:hypothetical protein
LHQQSGKQDGVDGQDGEYRDADVGLDAGFLRALWN